MKNTPYVKEYDNMGNVKNPIPTGYFHNFPNRKMRRGTLQKEKLFGKFVQIEYDKNGKRKRILHIRHIA
jgi:hypothetical protein